MYSNCTRICINNVQNALREMVNKLLVLISYQSEMTVTTLNVVSEMVVYLTLGLTVIGRISHVHMKHILSGHTLVVEDYRN